MKKAICVLMVVVLLLTLGGCNKQLVDMNFKFNKAILRLPDGTVVSGKVESWTDFEDGDQIQVKIDGVTYLVHSNNAALIKD